MRRPPREGQNRLLQLNATTISSPHCSHRTCRQPARADRTPGIPRTPSARMRAGGPLDRLPRPAPETHRSPAGPPDTEPYLPEYAGSTSSPKDTPWARCGAGVPGDSAGRRLRGAGTSRAPMRRRSPRPATMLRQLPIDPGTPGRWRLIELFQEREGFSLDYQPFAHIEAGIDRLVRLVECRICV
jgi:hypothetical protein